MDTSANGWARAVGSCVLQRVVHWGDENYVSIGRLFLGKSRHVFIPIGQSQKADFSIVSRPRLRSNTHREGSQ